MLTIQFLEQSTIVSALEIIGRYHQVNYALHLSGNVRETISGLIQDNTLDAGNSNLHCTSRYQSVYYLFRDKAQFT